MPKTYHARLILVILGVFCREVLSIFIEPVMSPHDGPPNEHLHCSMSNHVCSSGGTEEMSNKWWFKSSDGSTACQPVSHHDGTPNEHLHCSMSNHACGSGGTEECSMSNHACNSGGTEEVSNNSGSKAVMGQQHVALQRLQTQSTILTNGVSHIPKSNTPSSNRQKAAVIKSVTTCRSSSNRSKQNKNVRARKKAQKQVNTLLPVSPPLKSDTVYEKEGLSKKIVFVDGGSHLNPPINPAVPPPKNKKKFNPPTRVLSVALGELVVPTHHLDDPTKGLIYKPGDNPSQMILVPRIDAINCIGKRTIPLCNALDAVEENLRTSQDRGVTKHVMCEDKHKYSCVGTQACRGATGIRTMHYALEKNDPNSQKRIMKLFRQIEELYARFVDTDQIRLVKEAVDFVEAKTFSVPQESAKKAKATIYGAYASGVNVYLSSHWDQDFTYCATSIHQRKPYLESQNVVAYFAFPRLGIAIPLRPGDNLFFNPKEPHCIFSRCSNKEDIYCVSLYLKSANIGKNDNSTPLTHNQLPFLNQYNNK